MHKTSRSQQALYLICCLSIVSTLYLYKQQRTDEWSISERHFYLIPQQTLMQGEGHIMQPNEQVLMFVSPDSIQAYPLAPGIKEQLFEIEGVYKKKLDQAMKDKMEPIFSEIDDLADMIIQTVGDSNVRTSAPSMKKIERAFEKTYQKYNGIFDLIVDYYRFTVIGKDMETLRQVLATVQDNQHQFFVISVKNNFCEGGALRLSNVLLYHPKLNVIIEMQLILEPHAQVKKYLHPMYKFSRTLMPLLNKGQIPTTLGISKKAMINLLIDQANQAIFREADLAYLHDRPVNVQAVKKITITTLQKILQLIEEDKKRNPLQGSSLRSISW